jgi:hypothetical protein
MASSHITTLEVPFEALAKELGAKRAIEFISEIKMCYGDSTETLTIEQIEAEVKKTAKKRRVKKRV